MGVLFRQYTSWLILIILANTTALSQVAYLHYTDKDLTTKVVYDIFRDKNNLLWIGTDKGLIRYNGLRFEHFTTANGLPDNEIFLLSEDVYNRVWLMTFNGSLGYYQNGIFFNENNKPFLSTGIIPTNILNLHEEPDSSVTVLFGDRLHVINIQHEKIYKFNLQFLGIPNPALDIINVRKRSHEEFEVICKDKIITIDISGKVLNIQATSSSITYIQTQDQEYFYDQSTIYTHSFNPVAALPEYFVDTNRIFKLYIDKENVLVGTNHGLFINYNIHLFANHRVSAISSDAAGNYWIGTLDDGVFVIPHNLSDIQSISGVYEDRALTGTTYNTTICMVTENNLLYGIINGALKKLNSQPGLILSGNKYYPSFLPCFPGNDNYFCLTDSNTIQINGITTKQPKTIYLQYTSPGYKNIIKVEDRFYAHGPANILRLFFLEKSFSKKLPTKTVFANSRVYSTSIDTKNNLWISAGKGMYKLQNDSALAQPQFGGVAFTWFLFVRGSFIGCTLGNKLLMSRSVYSNYIHWDTINENCLWIKPYIIDSTHILISTDNLYRIIALSDNAGQYYYRVSTVENKFIPLKAEYIIFQNGKGYFFKDGNVVCLDSKNLIKQPDPPQNLFTTIQFDGHLYPAKDSISIDYQDAQNIQLEFIDLNFSGTTSSTEYELEMNGKMPDKWNKIGDHQINLVHLPYGEDMVRLRSKSVSSQYGQVASFRIFVRKPIWASWWFMCFFAFIFLLFAWILLQMYVKHVVKKKEKQRAEKIRILRSEYIAKNALMSPHFIFNAMNDIQGLLIENEKEAAHRHLNTFASLIRQNMHNATLDLVSLKKEIEFVKNYLQLEKLRHNDSFEYHFEIAPSVDIADILIPPMLIQPLVENAIKHGISSLQGIKGQIIVHIYNAEGLLYLEVKDNGAAFIKSSSKSNGQSFAINNLNERFTKLIEIYNLKMQLSIHSTNIETIARIIVELMDD